jgi:hypothetical protein
VDVLVGENRDVDPGAADLAQALALAQLIADEVEPELG